MVFKMIKKLQTFEDLLHAGYVLNGLHGLFYLLLNKSVRFIKQAVLFLFYE